MSFFEKCLILNSNFSESNSGAAFVKADSSFLIVDPSKDDDTEATEESIDSDLAEQKATIIQSQARGMITRKKFENREQLALDCVRSRVGHGIMKERVQRVGIETNIRAIKKILASNKKLWKSCKGNLRGERGTHLTKFTRTGFFHVQVVTDDDTMVFSSKPEISEKVFDTKEMAKIPEKLSGIFETKYDEDCFIDFDSLLERVQLLHEDVLGPFLVKLMKHIQSINESLSEINEWISEPSKYVKFLIKTFGLEQELEIPDEESLKKVVPTEILKENVVKYDYQIRARFDVELEAERTMLVQMLELVSS